MKKGIIWTIYLAVITLGGIICVHNEEFTTGACIALWYVIPMALIYGMILLRMRRSSSWKCVIAAILNTIVMGGFMTLAGIWFLERYLTLTF